MKKIIAVVCLCLCSCLLFCFGCSNSSLIKFNKKYYINNVQFMGFSGDRAQIQTYLESQDYVEEINDFTDYFDMALRLQIVFDGKSTGKLIIPQLVATFAAASTEVQNMIEKAIEAGIIDPVNGDFIVPFDYKKSSKTIEITSVHANIIADSENGDLSFSEAIDKLITYLKGDKSESETKIVNDNSNIIKINKGKLEMELEIEYKSKSTNAAPDVSTTLFLTIAR